MGIAVKEEGTSTIVVQHTGGHERFVNMMA